jgi:hypothetical protein
MKKTGLTTVFLLISCITGAQGNYHEFYSHNNLQYGLTAKATLFFDLRKQSPNPYIKIAADAGIASTFIDNWLYPSLNLELQLYNGGLGSRSSAAGYHGWDLDLLPAITLTAGWPNKFTQNRAAKSSRSLYYFSNFAVPALQNPFDHSLSIGTLWCFSTDSAKMLQQVGFTNLNIAGGFQFSYYNDGPPFKRISLGDGYDRYHTGGGMLSYNGAPNTVVNTIELAYHKFTGFTKSTFEASNKLYLAFMDYHDPGQKQFNRSLFDFTIGNPLKGYGLQLQQYNSVRLDLQHDIHTTVLDTYHMVPYTPLNYTIGLTYFGAYQQTGQR